MELLEHALQHGSGSSSGSSSGAEEDIEDSAHEDDGGLAQAGAQAAAASDSDASDEDDDEGAADAGDGATALRDARPTDDDADESPGSDNAEDDGGSASAEASSTTGDDSEDEPNEDCSTQPRAHDQPLARARTGADVSGTPDGSDGAAADASQHSDMLHASDEEPPLGHRDSAGQEAASTTKRKQCDIIAAVSAEQSADEGSTRHKKHRAAVPQAAHDSLKQLRQQLHAQQDSLGRPVAGAGAEADLPLEQMRLLTQDDFEHIKRLKVRVPHCLAIHACSCQLVGCRSQWKSVFETSQMLGSDAVHAALCGHCSHLCCH